MRGIRVGGATWAEIRGAGNRIGIRVAVAECAVQVGRGYHVHELVPPISLVGANVHVLVLLQHPEGIGQQSRVSPIIKVLPGEISGDAFLVGTL